MGIGAVFVSTLALSELKVPHNPPRDQQELLAATLQVIVSFVVLCSIIIRGSNPSSSRGFQKSLTVRRQMGCLFHSSPPAARSSLARFR